MQGIDNGDDWHHNANMYPTTYLKLNGKGVEMTKETHPASISETAFECPHCHAYTTQYWFDVYADKKKDNSVPLIPTEIQIIAIEQSPDIPQEVKNDWLDRARKKRTGLIFLGEEYNHHAWSTSVNNLFISKCYNCKKITAWVHDSIVHPPEKQGVMPNQDLDDDIIQVFEEARSIVGLSPRGAAALLRLSIQMLVRSLGEDENNLDNAIGNLVAKGLNPVIQQSLDIVRVIGNESVHPGTIDMKDDRDTANKLFGLVNLIADQMITHPKNVEDMYEGLPETKKEAIKKRDETKK